MADFFNFNLNFPFGMNSWFMPNLSSPMFYQPFQMPSFNMFSWFNPFSFNLNNSFVSPSLSLFSDFSNFYPDYSTNTDTFVKSKSSIDYSKDNLKLDGYNAFKGEKLAKIALKRSVGFTGWCATYVKSDIQEAGLGRYMKGDAYKMKDILKNNTNFKEVSPNDVDVKKLPAGCVLVYDKGAQGYSKDAGHTEITTGDGRAVSDGITENLYKKPSAIFIPV